ncbi:MAG: PilT/PilU family type 4a pilus ATPase [Planctomycetes bacterium]|nr:PilT/PilU family type 4a pilus ATPase [Planctomycetota bacterium]
MPDVKDIFAKMVEGKGSDLFIKLGAVPHFRSAGSVKEIDFPVITQEMINELYTMIADERVKKIFDHEGAADTAYELQGIGRFRTNIYRQKGSIAFCFRHVQSNIPQLESLHLPTETIKKLAELRRGMVLVTGTTGSGKSTTLAAMLNYVNLNFPKHIVTVEDPIEFLFYDKKSIVEQRELGVDTYSFSNALKHVVRENPDTIMIGEMRDVETVESAMKAAETGHLVLSTLHTLNCTQTVERIINFFPPHQHEFLCQQMSILLQGVCSMRLVKSKDGMSRVPAIEIMTNTPTIQELLFTRKTRDLYKSIKEGKYFGCQTFNQSLRSLIEQDLVSVEEALASSDNPDELKLELRGISKGSKTGDFKFDI